MEVSNQLQQLHVKQSCLFDSPALEPCVRKLVNHLEQVSKQLCAGNKTTGNSTAFNSGDCTTLSSIFDGKDEQLRQIDLSDEHSVQTLLEEAVRVAERIELAKWQLRRKLRQENNAVAKLKRRLHLMEVDRMRRLPALIQSVHDKFSTELHELQWHMHFRTRQKEALQNQQQILMQQNEKLRADIEFVESHRPLMENVVKKQAEVLGDIVERQRQVVAERQQIEKKRHERERALVAFNEDFEKQQANLTRTLTELHDQVLELRQRKQALLSETNKLEETYQIAKAGMETRAKELAAFDEQLKASQTEMDQVQGRVEMLERDIKQHRDRQGQLVNQREEMRKQLKSRNVEITQLTMTHKQELDDARRRYRQLHGTVEELRAQVTEAAMKITNKEHEHLQLQQEIEFTEAEHAELFAKLNAAQVERDKLQSLKLILKNEAAEELATTTRLETELEANITMLKRELQLLQKIEVEKLQQVERVTGQIEAVKMEMEEEIEQAENEVKTYDELLQQEKQIILHLEEKEAELRNTIERVRLDEVAEEEELEQERERISQQLEQVQSETQLMDERIQLQSSRVSEMELITEQNLEETKKSIAMQPVIESQIQEAEQQGAVFVENFQHVEALYHRKQAEHEELKARLTFCDAEQQRREQDHKQYCQQKQTLCDRVRAKLDEALAENERLAQVYAQMKREISAGRDAYIATLDANEGKQQLAFDYSELVAFHKFFARRVANDNTLLLKYYDALFECWDLMCCRVNKELIRISSEHSAKFAFVYKTVEEVVRNHQEIDCDTIIGFTREETKLMKFPSELAIDFSKHE